MVFQNASTCVRGYGSYETNGFEQPLRPKLSIGLEHLMVSVKQLDTYPWYIFATTVQVLRPRYHT